jgi:hypothetical protein
MVFPNEVNVDAKTLIQTQLVHKLNPGQKRKASTALEFYFVTELMDWFVDQEESGLRRQDIEKEEVEFVHQVQVLYSSLHPTPEDDDLTRDRVGSWI